MAAQTDTSPRFHDAAAAAAALREARRAAAESVAFKAATTPPPPQGSQASPPQAARPEADPPAPPVPQAGDRDSDRAPEPEADTPEGPEAPADRDSDQGDQPESEPEGDDAAADQDGDYVELPDGERIPLAELITSHKRFKDLQARVTRKEQALADERRAFDEQRKSEVEKLAAVQRQIAEHAQAVQAERAQYAAFLQAMQERHSQADAEWQKVPWDRLEAEDPVEYARQWARYQRHLEGKRAAEAEAQELRRRHAQQIEAATEARRAELRERLFRRFEHWRDEGARNADLQAMLATCKAEGFSEADMAETLDPRVWGLVMKAARYDQLMRSKASAVAEGHVKAEANGKIRIVKANAPRPSARTAEHAQMASQHAKFQRTGSIADAAAALRMRRSYHGAR